MNNFADDIRASAQKHRRRHVADIHTMQHAQARSAPDEQIMHACSQWLTMLADACTEALHEAHISPIPIRTPGKPTLRQRFAERSRRGWLLGVGARTVVLEEHGTFFGPIRNPRPPSQAVRGPLIASAPLVNLELVKPYPQESGRPRLEAPEAGLLAWSKSYRGGRARVFDAGHFWDSSEGRLLISERDWDEYSLYYLDDYLADLTGCTIACSARTAC